MPVPRPGNIRREIIESKVCEGMRVKHGRSEEEIKEKDEDPRKSSNIRRENYHRSEGINR